MKRQESIVKPNLRAPVIPAGRLILMPVLSEPGLVRELKTRSTLSLNLKPGRLYYLKSKAVLGGLLGAPACISSLEKIRNLGLKEITVLSYCGSLSSSLPSGQALVTIEAYSDEGTSRHYYPKNDGIYKPSTDLTARIKNFLIRKGLFFRCGTLVSTDAPYRETPSWLKKMEKKGIQAVDMEISAILSFSAFYGLKAAGLFLVSDELFSGQWHEASESQELQTASLKYFLPLLKV
jgi:purine-nucleoside phosphorylase